MVGPLRTGLPRLIGPKLEGRGYQRCWPWPASATTLDVAEVQLNQPGPPIINLRGDRVALGPLCRQLLPLYQRWNNDFEVGYTTLGMRILTGEAMAEWYRRHSDEERAVSFTVYELPGLRPIGTTGLFDIDRQHRRAEFGIRIGEKSCWGKGYGAEVTRLVLSYGFTSLNLHSVMLWVVGYNERGIRAYARAGFRLIGRRREAYRLGGKAYGVVFMDCLAADLR